MELNTLRALYIHELKDLFSAETQLVEALPKVAAAATDADLKAGFEVHLEETVEHVNRLEQILSDLGESTEGPKCKGMEGLLAETASLLEEEADPEVLDAGIIGGAQKVEHYEIAGYGTARTFAELLGEDDAAALLQTTLDEEHATDEKLTELAASSVNLAAVENEEDEEDEDATAVAGGSTKARGQKQFA